VQVAGGLIKRQWQVAEQVGQLLSVNRSDMGNSPGQKRHGLGARHHI
jgi:hypothetical protein